MNGKLGKNLTGKKTFKGIFKIEGEGIPIPGNNNEIVINFLNNGLGPLVYTGITNGQPHTYGYGAIFINSDLSQVNILKGDWDSENGLPIIGRML